MRTQPLIPVLVVLVCCLLWSNTSLSQTGMLLPPNQPEQDACTPLTLCGNTFFTPYSYQGIGQVLDVPTTPCFSGEANSMFMKITVATSGTIVFKIIPVDSVDDYDFAVIDITGTNCNNLSNIVRCNFNNNEIGSNPLGIVGLDTSSQVTSVPSGFTGGSFCSAINATAGDTYLIMINNFGSDYIFGSLSAGFTLDFSGSTATFNDGDPPNLSRVDTTCSNITAVTVHTTVRILCSSIAPDGSDFSFTPALPIIGATGVNCSHDTGYTNTITILLATPPAAGAYTLNAEQGTDGNTLLDLCLTPLLLPSSLPLIVSPTKDTTVTQHICYNQLPYVWRGKTVIQGGNAVARDTVPAPPGCDSIITLNLVVSDPPRVDTALAIACNQLSYTLPWGTVADTTGIYSHMYQNTAGCDSLLHNIVVVLDTPGDIHSSVSLCTDSSKIITAGSGFRFYLWSTGARNASITVHTQGIYTAAAIDSLGCIAHDTFTVAIVPIPVVALGNDTVLCVGSSKIIDAGAGFQSYTWNDGSTMQSLTVNTAGTYWVTAIDANHCPGSDTITLTATPLPHDFLPADTLKCSYSAITLQPITPFNSYLWSTGANTPSITVINAGNYTLQVTDHYGCVGIDAINIATDNLVNMHMDVPLCIDSTKTLDAGAGYSSYLWSNGATTQTVIAFAQGAYRAIATDALGCMAYDTFVVAIYPSPVVTLGSDAILCQGATKTIDAGAGFQSYAWNTGSTAQTIQAVAAGTYWVTVKDARDCPGSDTIVLVFAALPGNFLPPDTVKCFYSTITLQPVSAFNSYLWSTGAITEGIQVLDTGLYHLQVTDQNGCTGIDSIRVKDSACQEYVYIPTAFTPNNDGLNDVFKPAFKGVLVQYHLTIFNRLGQKIFETSDPDKGWDGTISLQRQDPGTYVWFCNYQLYRQEPHQLQGTVVLIR